MEKEEIEERIEALTRAAEELDGLYEALQFIGEALLTALPAPLLAASRLHDAIDQWDRTRLPMPGRAVQLLAELRSTADALAALTAPEAMDQERQRRERNAHDQ